MGSLGPGKISGSFGLADGGPGTASLWGGISFLVVTGGAGGRFWDGAPGGLSDTPGGATCAVGGLVALGGTFLMVVVVRGGRHCFFTGTQVNLCFCGQLYGAPESMPKQTAKRLHGAVTTSTRTSTKPPEYS